ncbi:MAG: hypothetical protein JJ902_23410 [Roseibium sp.]|nr:hypothetical protein [Roseibium sp.]
MGLSAAEDGKSAMPSHAPSSLALPFNASRWKRIWLVADSMSRSIDAIFGVMIVTTSAITAVIPSITPAIVIPRIDPPPKYKGQDISGRKNLGVKKSLVPA